SDLQQSVLDATVAGNQAYLAAWQAGSIPPGIPFSRPIFAHLGTREPYHAQAVPYFDSTDHMVFNDPWVGVPGTTLTNWPDEYIHSSSDDLEHVDPTQLKRNAYVVAATAWWLASAGPKEIDALGAFVAARGAGRLARDAETGRAWIASGSGDDASRRRAAADLLAVSLETDLAAVDSVRQIGAPGDAAGLAAQADMLRSVAKTLSAQLGPAPEGSDPAMTRLASRVPRRAPATLSEWIALQHAAQEKRTAAARAKREAADAEAAGPKSAKKTSRPPAPKPDEADGGDEHALSPLMGDAVFGFVDGKRNAAEIARRVCAEALSAGWWYYGETTPERVEKYLQAQVRAGLLAW
ncbi:MAG TPA: M28 family peptidase, partial [Thermoanaerobaculia bacterium]|nr:M28 family peptidase [Thermoanaerobaculia bacterium]